MRLFHPRTDIWEEHFAWDGALLIGRISIGRVTVQVLAMNADDLRLIRLDLRSEGVL